MKTKTLAGICLCCLLAGVFIGAIGWSRYSRRHSEPGNVITGAADPDSSNRFALWLLARQEQTKNIKLADINVPVAQQVSPLLANLQGLSKAAGLTEWQSGVVWSWGDMGPMETEVQKEIQRLDLEYQKNMYFTCVFPGGLVGRTGRACVMQIYACDAARNKFDEMAWKMTVATQMHNAHARDIILGAGAFEVAQFLRNNRGCQ